MDYTLSKNRAVCQVLEIERIQDIILSGRKQLSLASLLNVDMIRAELKAKTFVLEKNDFSSM